MAMSYLDVEDTAVSDQEAKPLAPGRFKPKRACQVPGCTADLEAIGKSYCSMKRICPVHMKADIIPIYDQLMRYCQQCGTLEPLTLFESNKRSCRDSLERRVKRPAQSEDTRERRRRRPASSFTLSSSNEAINSSWNFTAAVADAAAFGAAPGPSDVVLDAYPAAWDASLLGGTSVLQGSAAWEAAAAEAAGWGSNWLEQQLAAAPAAVHVAAAPAPARAPGGAAFSSSMTATDFNVPAATATAAAPAAALTTSCAAAGMPWQQQPVQLPPLCTRNLGAAAAGVHSPLGTSCSSSDSMDPAVLELEQFMLQELAAAGMLTGDTGSATRLPELPAVCAAPAPAEAAQLNQRAAHMSYNQQQQRAAAMMSGGLQHECSSVYPAMHQQWHTMAAPGTAADQRHATSTDVAGTMQSVQAATMMHAGCGAAAPALAAAVPASGSAGQRSGRNAHVMAQLQDRLCVLQSQMDDMQLMLGLLQNA